jgi:hypothetical protein
VVGVDKYDNLPAEKQLKKARNDARAIADAFTQLGYAVTLREDISLAEFEAIWTDFSAAIAPDDLVVFYFAGHGVEIEGKDYLVPRDAPAPELGRDERLRRKSLSLEEVINDLHSKKPLFSFLILDACRSYPIKRVAERSLTTPRELETVPPPKGMFVLYSAGKYETALDGLSGDANPNSVFTRALLPLLKLPGLSLTDIAYTVGQDVRKLAAQHGKKQNPAFYEEASGRFCLVGQCLELPFVPGGNVAPPPVSKNKEPLLSWAPTNAQDARDVARAGAIVSICSGSNPVIECLWRETKK